MKTTTISIMMTSLYEIGLYLEYRLSRTLLNVLVDR